MGIVAVRYKKIGFFGIGFGLGSIIALFLYQYIIAQIWDNVGDIFLYVLAITLGICGGLLALKIWKQMAVFSTSVVGSYFVVRSVSVYIGGFPGEIELANGVAIVSGWVYLYLVFIVGIAVLGMRYQFKNLKEEDSIDRLLDNEIHTGSRYKEILLDSV